MCGMPHLAPCPSDDVFTEFKEKVCLNRIPALSSKRLLTGRRKKGHIGIRHVCFYCESDPGPSGVVAPYFHVFHNMAVFAGGSYRGQNAAFFPGLQMAWTSHHCNAPSRTGYSLYGQVISASVGKLKRKFQLFALFYLAEIMLLSLKVNGGLAIGQGRQKQDQEKKHLFHKQSISR